VTLPTTTGRRGKLALEVVVNILLGVGAAVAVYALLGRGVQAGSVTLGTPRLMYKGRQAPPAGQPAGQPRDAPGRHSPQRQHTPPSRLHPGRPDRPSVKPVTPPKTPESKPEPRPESKPEPRSPEAPPKTPPKTGPDSNRSQPPPPAKPDRREAEEAIDDYRAGLNADSVRMVVRHHLPQVRACYDRALKQQSTLIGIVEIRFTISEEGRVPTSSVFRNTTGHEGLGKCLAVIVKRWRYPRPVGGAVEFVYPFVFSTDD